jgi:hypothetical protein
MARLDSPVSSPADPPIQAKLALTTKTVSIYVGKMNLNFNIVCTNLLRIRNI